MNKEKENLTKAKIKEAALEEFSVYGMEGARMEKIARKAGVNKAMLFYYFSSKDNLYKTLLSESFGTVSQKLLQLVYLNPTAKEFCEKAPQIYITFFTDNPTFVKMVVMGLIQQPDEMKKIVKDVLKMSQREKLPMTLGEKVKSWYAQGDINEPDPSQVMINILSLSLFYVIFHPFVNTIFNITEPIEMLKDKRIESVTRLLKGGLLNE